jgi:dTDP-4-dehydrorhamnose reductase
MKKNIAIFGANGTLAKNLGKSLELKGFSVSKYSHTDGDSNNPCLLFNIENPTLELDPEINEVIYFSWLPNRDFSSQMKSVFAVDYVSDWAKKNSKSFIFISSMAAAVLNPTSNYGSCKKFAEEKILKLDQTVIRPGTVISKSDKYGSSLIKLSETPFFIKYLTIFFSKLNFPVVEEKQFIDELIKIICARQKSGIYEIVTSWTSIQDSFGLKSGYFSTKIIKYLSGILPINTRDRIRTLIDLSSM